MLKRTKQFSGALFLLVVMASCGSPDDNDGAHGENNNARLVPVEMVTIESGSFQDFIRLTGTVEAIDDATISSESSGRILSIRELGERVREGEVIARLDDRLIQAQHSAAQAAFELSKDTYNRFEALYADSIVSRQDYENARAQYDQTRAQLDQAEKQLRDSQIESPFSGRIEERMVRTGELINPGQPVVRLVNTDRIRVLSGIPERYSGEIRDGTEVSLNFRAYGGQNRTSRITYAGNVIDPDTRTYNVEIELSNSEQLIKPEMVVDISITRRTLDDVIVIPRTAVLRDETGVFVFVGREENGRKVAELVHVVTGPASGSSIQVLDGLNEGDEVVVSGMRSLSIGDHLNVIKHQSSTEKIEELQREAVRLR